MINASAATRWVPFYHWQNCRELWAPRMWKGAALG